MTQPHWTLPPSLPPRRMPFTPAAGWPAIVSAANGHQRGGLTDVQVHPGCARCSRRKRALPGRATATPIQHLVVIFDENVSFDHYFGTYPHAANTDGNPFRASAGTPSVNGLTPALLTQNPNSANPQRLTPAQALTCDQNHAYTAEQAALDGGLLDRFVQATGRSSCPAPNYSYDNLVGSLTDMFSWDHPSFGPILLNPATGEVAGH
jgi:phosphoesterase family protein